jgi:hypothetical protein
VTRNRARKWWPAILNAMLLVMVLPVQYLLRQKLEALEMDLPFATEAALGPFPPVLLSCLLLAAVAVQYLLPERYFGAWESIFVILVGSVVGYFVIALLLPLAGGPQSLT